MMTWRLQTGLVLLLKNMLQVTFMLVMLLPMTRPARVGQTD